MTPHDPLLFIGSAWTVRGSGSLAVLASLWLVNNTYNNGINRTVNVAPSMPPITPVPIE
jgi:hypothetical protein